MALSNVNIVENTPGVLTVSWTQDTLQGNSTTLANADELCTLEFRAVGPSTCGSTTPVVLSDNNGAQETIVYPSTPAEVDFINGTLGVCRPFVSLAASGGSRTDPFTTNLDTFIFAYNFVGLTSLSFTIQVDPDKWLIASAYVNLPDAVVEFPPSTPAGTVTVSWTDITNTGLSVNDGQQIVGITLTSIGLEDCSAVTPMTFINGQTATNLAGVVDVKAVDSSLGVCFPLLFDSGGSEGPVVIQRPIDNIYLYCSNPPSVNTPPKGIVNLNYVVTNFLNIREFDFTIQFDATKWSFLEFSYINPLLEGFNFYSFDLSSAFLGLIKVSWVLPYGGSRSIPQEGGLFSMSLQAKNTQSCGRPSFVSITDALIQRRALETATNSEKLILGNPTPLEVCNIQVPPNTDNLSLKLWLQPTNMTLGRNYNPNAFGGWAPLRVDFRCKDFINLKGFQFDIAFNYNKPGSFSNIDIVNVSPVLGSAPVIRGDLSNIAEDVLRYGFWDENIPDVALVPIIWSNGNIGLTIPDDTILFTMRFDPNGGYWCNYASYIYIDNENLPRQAVKAITNNTVPIETISPEIIVSICDEL